MQVLHAQGVTQPGYLGLQFGQLGIVLCYGGRRCRAGLRSWLGGRGLLDLVGDLPGQRVQDLAELVHVTGRYPIVEAADPGEVGELLVLFFGLSMVGHDGRGFQVQDE